jgi:DNA-binding MarR family transcriptional regulator
MSNTGIDESSTDAAIMRYLVKNSVVDQTEKMALARISAKLQISSEQVEKSINSLSAKNLVRKVYIQRRVGFEVTPKGKVVLDTLAKIETARITARLQEAIQQERNAKRRVGAINKLQDSADKWRNFEMPDAKLMDEIAQEAAKFLAVTKEAQARQPLCTVDPENYDQEFAKYKVVVEQLIEQNSKLSRAVNSYAKIEDYSDSISADIKSITNGISRYEPMAEAAAQISQLKASVGILNSIQSQLNSFDKAKLSHFEQLKVQLGENSRLLDALKKPTHEFTQIKEKHLPENTNDYSDPELPIKSSGKTTGYSMLEKCIKCGAKRKFTPVTIG